MWLTVFPFISATIICIILIKFINSQLVKESSTIRMKTSTKKGTTIYKIQCRYLYLFWSDTMYYDEESEQLKPFYFINKSDAVRYVDVHKIKSNMRKRI